MKHSAIWKFWFGAALMLFAVLAQAAVSQIHTLSGTVSITYAGQAARAAQKGDRLESGTQVATGEKSFAMLRFEDGQIVALKSNSEFKVDAYRFNPKVDKDNQIGFTVSKGGLRAITGLIGKKNPDGFKLDTPTATIGIRGTTFDIHLDGGTFIRVTDGKIFIANPTGSLDLVAGQIAAILSRQTPPAPTTEGELPSGAKAGFQELENIVIDNLPPTGAGGGSGGLDADVIQALNETLEAIIGGGDGKKELIVTTGPLPPPPPEDDKVKIVDQATVENERRLASNKVDVFFLADNTGSMGGLIGEVKTNATGILNKLAGGDSRFSEVTINWGVGKYLGDPSEPYETLTTAYQLMQGITADKTQVQDAINDWNASGGGDTPEANFYAMHQAATSGSAVPRGGSASNQATGWRSGASRVMLVFGDEPAWQTTINEKEAGQVLKEQGVKVSFIDSYNLNGTADAVSSAWDSATGSQLKGAAQELADRTGGMYIKLPSEYTTAQVETAILNAVYDAIADNVWTGGHMASLSGVGTWRNRTASAIEVAFSGNNADFTLRQGLLDDELISLDTSSANLVAGRPYYQKSGAGTWDGADGLWVRDLSNSQFVQWMPDKDFFHFQLKGGGDSQVLTGYYGRTLDAAKLPGSGITVFDLFSNSNDPRNEGPWQVGAGSDASGELVVNWANRKVFGFDNSAPLRTEKSSRGFFIGEVNSTTRKLEGRYFGFEVCEGCIINVSTQYDIEDANRGNTNMQLYGLNQPVGFGGTFGAYWDNGSTRYYTDMMLTGLLNTTNPSYTASPADGEVWNGFASAYVTTPSGGAGAVTALSAIPADVAITLTPSTGAVAAAVNTYEQSDSWDGTAHTLNTASMTGVVSAYVTPKAFGVIGTSNNDDGGLVTATAQTDSYQYLSWGHWGRTEVVDSVQKDIEPASLWVAGRLTPDANIPTSGSGSYTGEVRGYVIDVSNTVRAVAGTTALTANFANGSGTLGGSFNNLTTSQGTWVSTATVIASWGATNAVSGTLSGSGITSGSIHGAFFGPNAQELGGNWAIQKDDSSKGAGIHRSIRTGDIN